MVCGGLQEERIAATTRIMPAALSGTELDRTLLCFVLVDKDGKHAFCSRYDFGPWPLLGGVSTLPPCVAQVGSSNGMALHACCGGNPHRQMQQAAAAAVWHIMQLHQQLQACAPSSLG
eukprot:GHRQ01034191.1.p3 GENE.GHRQ01034191.1~~GHRQ01034191.1.p3  ORF type:complete len:118 (-),score=44.34 GHRQ01034191.1:100-453(-)